MRGCITFYYTSSIHRLDTLRRIRREEQPSAVTKIVSAQLLHPVLKLGSCEHLQQVANRTCRQSIPADREIISLLSDRDEVQAQSAGRGEDTQPNVGPIAGDRRCD